MLKLKNRITILNNITYTAKIVVVCLFAYLFIGAKKHPYYISVVDMKYFAAQNTMQISTRMFSNDLEDALLKSTGKRIDLLNPKNQAEADTVLFQYIKQRFSIKVNSTHLQLKYLGYEKEDESIWAYMEIKSVKLPKHVSINTRLLYDYLPNQTIIVHCDVNSTKKSSKINNPDTAVDFSF